MSITTSIALTIAAGFMHGTYAFPMKYMKTWEDENIWLVFSLITFLILPLASLMWAEPHIFQQLIHIPSTIILTLIIGGFLFGLGMVVFTYSMIYVGMGISFIVNMCSGTIISTILPLLWIDPALLWSKVGALEIIALTLFLLGMVTSYYATAHRSHNQTASQRYPYSFTLKGIILGILSGVLTSAEGFSYSYATTLLPKESLLLPTQTITQLFWMMIFSSAFLPYFFYFLRNNIKNRTLKNIFKSSAKYYVLSICMGILYFGSLLLFSHATLSLGSKAVLVTWPMLMILIVMTGNFWSIVHQEWRGAGILALRYLAASIIIFIMAVVILTTAKYFNRSNSPYKYLFFYHGRCGRNRKTHARETTGFKYRFTKKKDMEKLLCGKKHV